MNVGGAPAARQPSGYSVDLSVGERAFCRDAGGRNGPPRGTAGSDGVGQSSAQQVAGRHPRFDILMTLLANQINPKKGGHFRQRACYDTQEV